MRMVGHRLTPTVQHRHRADLSPQMARLGGDIAHRLGRSAEQDGIGHALVLERDLGRGCRQSEDDMEIQHRQQLGLPRFEPGRPRQALTLRTVPVAAGVVGAADQSAIVALFDMPAERGRPASLDRCHHAPLDPAEMGIVLIKERRAVAAEDIRHLHPASGASSPLRRAASPRGADDRAGSVCHGWCWSQPAHSAPLC